MKKALNWRVKVPEDWINHESSQEPLFEWKILNGGASQNLMVKKKMEREKKSTIGNEMILKYFCWASIRQVNIPVTVEV